MGAPVLVGSVVADTSGTGGGPAFTDAIAYALELGLADAQSSPTDALTAAIEATYADTQATPTEAVIAEVFGPQFTDATAAPTDGRDSLIVRWATSNTTSGTAPTNPTNAQGERNGTTATVKTGGVAAGTSVLTLTIAPTFTEIPAGATRTLRAYYSFAAGTADSMTAVVSYRQVGQSANTTVNLPATGDYLTTGTPATLTNIDRTVAATVTFTHSATVVATGGQINVDAVGIETTGAL